MSPGKLTALQGKMRSSRPFLVEQRCSGGGERDGKGTGGLERAGLRRWCSKGKLISPLTQGDSYPSKKKEGSLRKRNQADGWFLT